MSDNYPPGVTSFDIDDRFGDEPDTLMTEYVSENYQPRPGQMDTRYFWVAYPDHVAAYGHMDDRISRASGRGDTERAALDDARRNGDDSE